MIGLGLFITFLSLTQAELCRVLAISGGGSRGSYEAGVIWQLVNSLPASEVAWDVVTGISTGSINSAGVATFAKGDQKAMADHLLESWRDIRGSFDIYQGWTLGVLQGLFFKSGLYNTAPLQQFLYKHFGGPVKRPVVVGAVSLETGQYKTFNGTDGTEFLQAVLASAAPPFFFPQRTIGQVEYMDGGTVYNLDVPSGIQYCLDQGFYEYQVVVDVILASRHDSLDPEQDDIYYVNQVRGRVQDIAALDNCLYFLLDSMEAYPYVNYRYILQPSQSLSGGLVPLDFDPANLEFQIELGKNDTIKEINSNPNSRKKGEQLVEESMKRTIYMNQLKIIFFQNMENKMWRLFYLFALLGISSAQTCRVISLQGGGSHGAYQAGAIWQLVNSLPLQEVSWDVVVGVSTGALNAGGVSQFAKGQEKEMADFVVDVWRNLNGSSSIYQNWPGGIVDGLLFRPALYDTTPLKNTVSKYITKAPLRNIIVGATNLNSGEYKNFNQTSPYGIINAILASAAPPFFFPFVELGGIEWADGGCVINMDVFAGINKCLEINGNKQEDVVVDMVFDSKVEKLNKEDSDFSVLTVYSRVDSIQGNDNSLWYYYDAVRAFPDVNFRYTILPVKSMPGGIVPLNFDKEVLETEIQEGMNDTLNVINSYTDPREQAKDLYKKNIAKIRYAEQGQ